ncbi:MAG: M48 family peptidase [Candidatus Tectomicrobia bacterium]|uniref:M48 family peptidase n=1 Tax=Tectimicrobiota bacterium TaxID=2528274 RepID=A0A932I1X4_UNCTE|nr:M48 family peptidase [Candidatus Tectomicrobia bacterium]
MAQPSKSQLHAQDALNGIVAAFARGEVPAILARTLIKDPGIPSAKWSLCNQILCALAGTEDARGFRQWKAAGRHVKKGAKAFHILAPRMVKVPVKSGGHFSHDGPDGFPADDAEFIETGPAEYREAFAGRFFAAPVFRLEDTEGEPLAYLPPVAPPLAEVAEAWGVRVSYLGCMEGAAGSCTVDGREIRLATQDEDVFFHELAHAADARLRGRLTPGQHVDQEVAAEMAAAVLSRLYGVQLGNEGRAYDYIAKYAGGKKAVVPTIFRAMKRIRAILGEILAAAEAVAA